MQYNFVMFQTQAVSLFTFRFAISMQAKIIRILLLGKIWKDRQKCAVCNWWSVGCYLMRRCSFINHKEGCCQRIEKSEFVDRGGGGGGGVKLGATPQNTTLHSRRITKARLEKVHVTGIIFS